MKRLLEEQIDQGRRYVLQLLKNDPEALPGACLYHALVMHHLFRLPIVAGSYSWMFTRFDNGSNPTHFSCVFDQRAELVAKKLLRDQTPETPILPEMHVWNLYQGKVLDLSTLYLPQFAERAAGFKFDPTLTPPPYYLGKPKDSKWRWLYQEHPVATLLANSIAEKKKLVNGDF